MQKLIILLALAILATACASYNHENQGSMGTNVGMVTGSDARSKYEEPLVPNF